MIGGSGSRPVPIADAAEVVDVLVHALRRVYQGVHAVYHPGADVLAPRLRRLPLIEALAELLVQVRLQRRRLDEQYRRRNNRARDLVPHHHVAIAPVHDVRIVEEAEGVAGGRRPVRGRDGGSVAVVPPGGGRVVVLVPVPGRGGGQQLRALRSLLGLRRRAVAPDETIEGPVLPLLLRQ